MNQSLSLLRRNWRSAMGAFAMAVDLMMIAGCFLLAAQVTYGGISLSDLITSHHNLLLYSLGVFLIFFTSVGLYRTIAHSSFSQQAYRAGKACLYSAATILSTLFLLRNLFYPRSLLLTFLVIFPAVYMLVWAAIRGWLNRLQRDGFGRWNTLAIGADPDIRRVLSRIELHPELGYDVTGTLALSPASNGNGLYHVDREAVERLVRENNIGLIVFSSSRLNGSFDELEQLCRVNRVAMRVVSAESDYLFSKARLHDIAGIPLFTPERKRIERIKRWSKRGFDLVGAVLALILLAPVFLIVAVATKLESRGPVFFKQLRSLGDQDTPFEFYKFRSMYHEADELKESLLSMNESDGALFKIKDDPRLTRIGKFIRRYSIDELPQLINVIRGEMSLVGPRPLPVKDFDLLGKDDHMGGYFRHRASMKPGMTGLWQISGRSELGFREMVLLDLYYIENQTILFDLEILAQTIPVVIFGRGAY